MSITVNDDGLAAEYGLNPGDVISEAAQEEVKSAKMLSEQAQAAKKAGKPLLILVDRKGDLRFIAISFEKGKKK